MNLKLRFKNAATCSTFILACLAFIYQILGIFGIVPGISQDMLVELVACIINILIGLGILVDPTSSGITDSELVMDYDAPRKDTDDAEGGAGDDE